MAVVKIPFCVTEELAPPFVLDEDYNSPNGVKSIMLDKSSLQVVIKRETVDVPDIGEVELCVYYVVGTVRYICNAFPIVKSECSYDVQQYSAVFDAGTPSSECVPAPPSDALCWLSASGCVQVHELVGGSCQAEVVPEIDSVEIEDLAVANNQASSLRPTCTNGCGEEEKRVIKWRGCIVITTSEE